MKLLCCSFVKPLFEGSLSRLTSPSSAYYAWPATFAPPRCNLLCLRARSEAPILRGRSPRHRRARRRARCQVRMSRGALSSCERAVRRRCLRECTAHACRGQGQRRTAVPAAVTGAHWRAAREGRQDHSGRTRNAEATTAISGEGFWVGRRGATARMCMSRSYYTSARTSEDLSNQRVQRVVMRHGQEDSTTTTDSRM